MKLFCVLIYFSFYCSCLLVAETRLSFEHRDLHWGNVLIGDTDDKSLRYAIGDETYEVKTEKVIATVIDFSLSRLTTARDECNIFNDLGKDPNLFVAKGDYQFDIYRSEVQSINLYGQRTNLYGQQTSLYGQRLLVASAWVAKKSSGSVTFLKIFLSYRMMKEEVGDEWQEFHPKTNVLWLHYLLDKLLTSVPYKVTKSQIHRKGIAKLKSLKAKIMEYPSALGYVLEEGDQI